MAGITAMLCKRFHRVDPRLRVLKAVLTDAVLSHSVVVSSRRPEVEGTERLLITSRAASGSSFHRVDPRLRVLKVQRQDDPVGAERPFHRVDPRLRVLKARVFSWIPPQSESFHRVGPRLRVLLREKLSCARHFATSVHFHVLLACVRERHSPQLLPRLDPYRLPDYFPK